MKKERAKLEIGMWNLKKLDAEEYKALVAAYGHNCWER